MPPLQKKVAIIIHFNNYNTSQIFRFLELCSITRILYFTVEGSLRNIYTTGYVST